MAGRRRSDRALRSKLRSPGRPLVAQQAHRRRFLVLIAAGQSSEDAAIGAGVSAPVGARWFRKAGGMPPSTLAPSSKPLSGRCLSFAEREELAIQHARAPGCGRSPGRWGGRDRRSRGSCAATLPPAAASWMIGPRRRSGMLNGRSAPEASEAGAQRDAADLCAGSIGWHGGHAQRCCGSWADGILERSPTRTTERSAMGFGVEPGADCLPPTARLCG